MLYMASIPQYDSEPGDGTTTTTNLKPMEIENWC